MAENAPFDALFGRNFLSLEGHSFFRDFKPNLCNNPEEQNVWGNNYKWGKNSVRQIAPFNLRDSLLIPELQDSTSEDKTKAKQKHNRTLAAQGPYPQLKGSHNNERYDPAARTKDWSSVRNESQKPESEREGEDL